MVSLNRNSSADSGNLYQQAVYWERFAESDGLFQKMNKEESQRKRQSGAQKDANSKGQDTQEGGNDLVCQMKFFPKVNGLYMLPMG